MAKVLKFGILGCGKIANVDHVPGLQATKGVEIAALCDIVPKQMEILSSAFGLEAERFTDQKAFLASGLDAVVVCTPNSLHLPQTLAACKAGLHVLCEKPMAADNSATSPSTSPWPRPPARDWSAALCTCAA